MKLVRLLARKIEIEEQHNRITKMSAESFGKIIPECDGNFDIKETAYELNPKQKFVQACAKMTSVAKLFLESTQITEYEELKTALIEELVKEYNSAELHKKLSDRVKKITESFHEYLLHMRKNASLSDIEETSIVRYVVDGLRIKSENKPFLYKSLQEEYEIFEDFNKNERSYSVRAP